MNEPDYSKYWTPIQAKYLQGKKLCPVKPVDPAYDAKYAKQHRESQHALPIDERDPEYLGPLSHDLHASLYMQLPLTYEAARKKSNPPLFARSLRLRPELEQLKRGGKP